ncbi:MAG: prepilin-type N-terminal cleavage/methylation domain-containing protein [Phycisphaerales bacterium JB037]
MRLRAHSPSGRRGFTLVELLLVIAIIATLLALALPGLAGTMSSARSFKCQMGLRAIAFDFSIFADDQLHGDRGDDAQLGANRFRLETFQEAQYRIDEFWSWGGVNEVRMPDEQGNDPLRCPEQTGEVVLRRAVPCSSGGVGPPEEVSYGFNVRLHVGEVERAGRTRLQRIQLTSRIIETGDVPLVWDVDGRAATDRGVSPVFSGPSLDSTAAFANDRYWFPGMRHAGSLNIAFIDGHVEGTATPLKTGRWGFQPVR